MRQVLLYMFLLTSVVAFADKFNIFGAAYNESTGGVITDCEITFWQNDSIMYETMSTEEGYFIRDMEEGEYVVEAAAFGFELFRTKLNHREKECYNVKLTPRKVVELDGVEVVADKSMTVTYTATGEVYYLSKDAKERGNPFMALQEIPVIFSDPNNKSVTGPDGTVPLILVDGREVNTGIAPIDSHRIEAVEVITSPSSKYVHQGYSCVINIKLKELTQPYVWVELDGYGQVPLNYGKGEGYFEVGSPVFGVYSHLSGTFTKKESVSEFNERTDLYTRDYKKLTKRYIGNEAADVMLKWMPNAKNYFLASINYSYNRNHSNVNGSGLAVTKDAVEYDFMERTRDISQAVTGTLYFSHSFSDNQSLSATGSFSHSANRPTAWRNESYGEEAAELYATDFRNRADLANLTVSWMLQDPHSNSFGAGLFGSLSFNRVNDLKLAELFPSDDHTMKIYASWSRTFFGKLRCSLSPFMTYFYMKDADYHRNYLLPGGSAGVSYRFNQEQGLNLQYYLTQDPPRLSYLNPYDTSTDPLLLRVGNPMLRPQLTHDVFLTYSYVKNGWRAVPTVSFITVNNQIVNTGYVNENGAYVSTYKNEGSVSSFSAGLSASKRLNNGRIGLEVHPTWEYYPEQPKHFYIRVRADFNKYFDKWNVAARIGYKSREISLISIADYNKPIFAEIRANYNITPNLYVGVVLNNCLGRVYVTETTQTNDYYQKVRTHHDFREFSAMFLVSWTLRKNIKRMPPAGVYGVGKGVEAVSIER